MKVIISHDVDHLSVREHNKDLIVPKFLIRSLLEWGTGAISIRTLMIRIKDLIDDNWSGMDEIIEFDKTHGVPSTFFFAMDKGIGLSYSISQAEFWIRNLIDNGFEVGVHGIEHNDEQKMKAEYEKFCKISGLTRFGIRMHYLRKNSKTISKLEKIGYLYDTTEYNMKLVPYFRVGELMEFPLTMMDGTLFFGHSRIQRFSFQEAVDAMKRLIDDAILRDDESCIVNILFHPLYFSEAWPDWKRWYIWLIEYCKQNNMEFVNYGGMVHDIKSNRDRFTK